MPDRDRCVVIHDPDNGAVLASAHITGQISDEAQRALIDVALATRRQMAEDPEVGVRQQRIVAEIRERVAARAALRRRMSGIRAAYRAKRRGWRRG